MFAPRPSSGDPLRHPRAPRSGGAHDLQLPRPADQPGGRRASADRRLGPAATWRRWRWPSAGSGTRHALVVCSAGTASTSCRSSAATQVFEVHSDGTESARGYDDDARRRSGFSVHPAAGDPRWRSRPQNAAITRAILAGEARRRAGPGAAQRRRRDPTPVDAPTPWPRAGSPPPQAAIDSGAASSALERLRGRHPAARAGTRSRMRA